MGNCRKAWGSCACVICPSNGRGNTKPSDLLPINPSGRTVDSQFYPSQAGALILGPLGLRNRLLYFQEREFSSQRKAEMASPKALGLEVQLEKVTVPHWARGEETAALVDADGLPGTYRRSFGAAGVGVVGPCVGDPAGGLRTPW